MAEEKAPTLSDNLATPGSMETAPPVGTTESTSAPTEDKFKDKSREEIAASYKELESKLVEQGGELGQLRDFIGRVGMFFKVEGDQVNLNDDVLKKYAEVQGWLPKETTDNSQPNVTTTNGNEPVFEPNEQTTIKDMIRQEIQSAFKESLEPFQQQFTATQQQQWIERVQSKHPDFANFKTKVGDFLNKTGFQVNSADDLERAFIATKALTGEMVDKRQTESHIAELQKTLSTLTPGARGPMKDPNELSNAELLGLDTPDTPAAKALQTLTGKPYMKD
jgi:hypothetical protein